MCLLLHYPLWFLFCYFQVACCHWNPFHCPLPHWSHDCPHCIILGTAIGPGATCSEASTAGCTSGRPRAESKPHCLMHSTWEQQARIPHASGCLQPLHQVSQLAAGADSFPHTKLLDFREVLLPTQICWPPPLLSFTTLQHLLPTFT